MRSRTLMIAAGIILLGVAGTAMFLLKPFEQKEHIETHVTETVMQDPFAKKETVIQEMAGIKYDTEMGNRDITEEVSEGASAFFTNTMSVGYRRITGGYDDYISKNQSYASSRISFLDNEIALNEFLSQYAQDVVDDMAEIQVDFTPEYEIDKNSERILNGKMSVRVFKTNNIGKWRSFFGISDLEKGVISEKEVSVTLESHGENWGIKSIASDYQITQ